MPPFLSIIRLSLALSLLVLPASLSAQVIPQPGGFQLDNRIPTTTSDGPMQTKCGSGLWNGFPPGSFGGFNYGFTCLIQYNMEDYSQAHIPFGIVHNIPGSTPFPDFLVTNTGVTVANSLWMTQNNGQWFQNGTSPTWTVNGPIAAAPIVLTTDVTTANAGGMYGLLSIGGINRALYGATNATAPDLIHAMGKGTCCPIAGSTVYRLLDNGHQHEGGAAAGEQATPSVESCGGGGSVTGSDGLFTITFGSIPVTSCSVTFGQAWTSRRVVCLAESETDVIHFRAAATTTRLALTSNAEMSPGSLINVICRGTV